MTRYKQRNISYSLDFKTANLDSRVIVENNNGRIWDGTSSLTVFFRFKPSPIGGTTSLFAIPAISGNNRVYVRQLIDRRVSVVLGALSNEVIIAPLNFFEWKSFALVIDKPTSKFRVFIDGALALDWTTYTPGTGYANIGIGNNPSSLNESTTAKLCDVAVWSRSLSANEIQDVNFNNIIPTSNLKGLWRLDEGTGTIATDASGNGYSGTIEKCTWSPDAPLKSRSAAGRRLLLRNMSGSLRLNGDNGAGLSIPVTLQSKFTIASWLKIDPSQSATYRRIFSCASGNGSSDAGVEIMIWPTDIARVRVESHNGVSTSIYGFTHGFIGKYFHIAVTVSGTSLKLYINGLLAYSDTLPASMAPASGQTLTIGNASFAIGPSLRGVFKEVVLVNNGTLADSDLPLLMNGIFPQNATAICKLDEGAGTIANDISGSGNNGTITGGAWSTDVPIAPRVASTRTAAA